MSTTSDQGADVKAHLGARIRAARTALGMSQGALGAALGVTFQQVQKYEKGKDRIAADRLLVCAKALGQEIAWFFEDVPIEREKADA